MSRPEGTVARHVARAGDIDSDIGTSARQVPICVPRRARAPITRRVIAIAQRITGDALSPLRVTSVTACRAVAIRSAAVTRSRRSSASVAEFGVIFGCNYLAHQNVASHSV